jgi:hypothetical protein
MAEKYTVPQRLGRTVDGRIVDYYSPEAAFLAYYDGQVIPMATAIADRIVIEVKGTLEERPDDAEPEKDPEEEAEASSAPAAPVEGDGIIAEAESTRAKTAPKTKKR